jgi:Phage protein Gp138 N-terminal domain/GpV Apex motif
MNLLERLNDPEENIRQAIGDALTNVMTSYPVKIIRFDPATMTADATILSQVRVEQNRPTPSGDNRAAQDAQKNRENIVQEWQDYPPLVRCPVIFITGGGFTVIAPPRPGDECLAFFAQKSIDDWWQFSGNQRRRDLRSHSISDAFILAGVRSRPNVITNINPDAFEIRSEDGQMYLRLDATGITITAPTITLNGQVVGNQGGEFTNDVTAAGKSMAHHLHGGVQAGGSNTGPPL